MSTRPWQRRKRWLMAVAAVFVVIQFVPYGRARNNPPTTIEPVWDSADTRALAGRACFDCHSNQTVWPVYARVAPVSWLVYYDVTNGRAELNFSEWHRPQKEAREAPEVLREGEMPPVTYRLVHAHARLTPAERERLARGLARTLAGTRQASLR